MAVFKSTPIPGRFMRELILGHARLYAMYANTFSNLVHIALITGNYAIRSHD